MKEPWFKKKWVTFFLHAAFWALLFFLPYLLQPSAPDQQTANRPRPQQRLPFDLFHLGKAVFWTAVFYFNAYVLVPRLVQTKRYRHYALALVFVVGI